MLIHLLPTQSLSAESDSPIKGYLTQYRSSANQGYYIAIVPSKLDTYFNQNPMKFSKVITNLKP